ncbi:hypothetical protein BDV19DRAFT_394927 [Aspergillus venezuelensis]
MNLKTAITSALFAALAPCLQAQSVPAGTNLGLCNLLNRDNPDQLYRLRWTSPDAPYSFRHLHVFAIWTPANILACDLFSPEDVRNIDVHPSSPVFSEVQCTIYSDTGCAGDEYTVGADSHAFTKSFITGSFKCVVPRD